MSDCEHKNFLGALEYVKEHFQDFVNDHNSASKLIGELEEDNRRLYEALEEIEKAACSPVRIKRIVWDAKRRKQ